MDHPEPLSEPARARAQRVVLLLILGYMGIAAIVASDVYQMLLIGSAAIVALAYALARTGRVDAAAVIAGLGCALTPYVGMASPEPTTSPLDELGWLLLAAVIPSVGASTRVYVAFGVVHFVIVTALMQLNAGIPTEAVARVGGLLGVLVVSSATQIWVIRRHERARARQAADLREALVAAERSQKAREAFLGLITHELRTPLHGVLGAATVLGESEIDDQQELLLRAITTSGGTLMGLIDDVLDLTRGEADFSIVEASFCPARRLEALVEAQRAHADAVGVAVEVETDPASRRYWSSDRRRIDQIINNVLGNALAQPHVGHVRVRCTIREGDEATLRVEIEDDGPGIPPEAVERVFEPFAQLEGERKGAGVGLGLPLSRRLARRMGGELRAETRPPPGACFVLELPIRPSNVPPSSTGTAASHRSLDMAVLVIDDNPVNILVSRAMLEKLGCQVETCTSGPEGLEHAAKREFALMLVDYRMPGMNGAQTIEALRAQASVSEHAWIVCVTASDSPEVQDACRAAGADAIWRKPLDLPTLSAEIRRLRSSRAPQRPTLG